MKSLIIDSWFDSYLGVVSLIEIIDGSIQKVKKLKIFSTGQTFTVDKLESTPKKTEMDQLSAGQVGYMVAGIKDIYGAPVGDTIIESKDESTLPLPGFKKVLPKVFASLFTVNSDEYEKFRDALAKLTLNDSSLVYEPKYRMRWVLVLDADFLAHST